MRDTTILERQCGPLGQEDALEAFLSDWLDRPGGAEISNSQPFLIELCDVLGVARPQRAARGAANDYTFERGVRSSDGEGAYHRIDLYKRGCFVLETKQSFRADCAASRLKSSMLDEGVALGARTQSEREGGPAPGWNRLMQSALAQARRYASELPPAHASPPFLIVCDVGHAFEIWADFTGTGRGYAPFPSRKGCRIFLRQLRDPQVRATLKAIWCDPLSLDPARRKRRVTREVAAELGRVWAELQTGPRPEDAASFLMRCILTMFASSVGLLPERGFADLLARGLTDPGAFCSMAKELWTKMNDPVREARFFAPFDAYVPHFGGDLFHDATVFKLKKESIEALLRAAECSWSEVEPAIFGALLENALGTEARRRLGAHYTPRRHVERVVEATIMEPLREDWRLVCVAVDAALDRSDRAEALALARAFHNRLRHTRVLDPACGTGNFLYIALELMKTLEAQVLETLARAGATESLGIDLVDPGQFLGIEVNPTAAIIAELVLWIGFLQLHYRTHEGHPAEPILRAAGAIERRNAIVTWVGQEEGTPVRRNGEMIEVRPDPRRPEWPDAEYIVGNPPFLGGKDLRLRLGDGEAEALWAAHPHMNRSADLVMYWWDHAAELLVREGSPLRRFGFVTTNSITQAFQRQTLERRLGGPRPIHLAYAIPDHPWIVAGRNAAAVRVAMTVAQVGPGDGLRLELISETSADGDEPTPAFNETKGRINADLTIGPDLGLAEPLAANRDLCSPGVKLHGAGFIVSEARARDLGLGRRPGLEAHIHPYRNGRDLVQQPRGAWVIDLYPLTAEEVRGRFPEVYQHLLATVKPHRDVNRMAFRREHWWWFGATHETYRSFTAGLTRYIATPETAKHRIFAFLPGEIRADNMLVAFGLDDAFHLGVLSSRVHVSWARATGAVLEDRPRYTKSACFDPFPFPDPPPALRRTIAETAEELDATRAQVRAERPELTLTALYNGLDALRTGAPMDAAVEAGGRVLILKELHARLDALTLQAYGWAQDLPTPDLLAALAHLNAERAGEERAGRIRWLRPAYQRPRARLAAPAIQLDLGLRPDRPTPVSSPASFPRTPSAQSVAVLQMLDRTGGPLGVREVCARFGGVGAGRLEKVAAALLSLARNGHISVLEDGRCFTRLTA